MSNIDGIIDGTPVVSFTELVDRIASTHPSVPKRDIEAIVIRENEAATGGAPLVVPASLELGVREVLTSGAASGERRVSA